MSCVTLYEGSLYLIQKRISKKMCRQNLLILHVHYIIYGNDSIPLVVRNNKNRKDLKLRNTYLYTIVKLLGSLRIIAINLRSLSKNHIAVFGIMTTFDIITVISKIFYYFVFNAILYSLFSNFSPHEYKHQKDIFGQRL